MEVTRRGFLKATGLGTTIALGFDVSRAEAEMREFKISRTTETRSTCPYCAVSCGVIIHTLGDRAKNADGRRRPRRGRSRPPDQPRHALPQGRDAQGRHQQPEPPDAPEGAPAGLGQLGGHLLGRRDRADRPAHQGRRATRCFVAKNAKGQVVNRNPGIGDDRRLHRHQRVQLPPVEGHHGPGGAVPGHPGPGLTRPHGGQFGRHVRARGDDQRMGRHQECRRHPRDGRQPRREPSLRLQVVHRGEEDARREDRRGRSALHAHGRRRGLLLADPRRNRHRVPARHHPLRDRDEALPRGLRQAPHERARTSSARSSASTTASSPASTRPSRTYDKTNWAYEADPKTKAYAVDPTLENPRCVFQLLKKHVDRYTPEMVERICGTPKETFLKVCEIVTSTGNARARAARSRTRSAGRSTRSASRSSARRRCCSSSSATSGGRAAASTPSAATRTSRARPTSAGTFEILPGYLKTPAGPQPDPEGVPRGRTRRRRSTSRRGPR